MILNSIYVVGLFFVVFFILKTESDSSDLQCVIINNSDDKKTVRSRVEDSAVDY